MNYIEAWIGSAREQQEPDARAYEELLQELLDLAGLSRADLEREDAPLGAPELTQGA